MQKICPVCESVCREVDPYITFYANERYYCPECGSSFTMAPPVDAAGDDCIVLQHSKSDMIGSCGGNQ